MAMTRMSSADIARKWAQNLGASIDRIKSGVQSVAVNPCSRAADRADYWLQRITQSKEKWVNRLRQVSKDNWIQLTLLKGIPVIPQRAEQARGKFAAFMEGWMAYQRGPVAQALSQMPRGTLEANIQRATTVIRMNAEWKGRTGAERLPYPSIE